MTDNDLFSSAPELTAPQTAAAPIPAASSSPAQRGPPPLPDEPDDALIARAAVAEGDPNNPQSQQMVAGVIRNRMAKTGETAAQIISDSNQFQSYANGSLQKIDPDSPAYKAALTATSGVSAGQFPYDSFYAPALMGGKKASFDDGSGAKIGSQLFFQNKYVPADLSPAEQQAWESLQTKSAATPAGQTPGTGDSFNIGSNKQLMTAAQEAAYTKIANDPSRGISPGAIPGTAEMPYAVQPGGVLPQTPGAHYVDLDGVEHVVPGGLLGQAKGVAAGIMQGLGPDTLASANRIFGAGLMAPNTGNPALDVLATSQAQAQGGPTPQQLQAAAAQGLSQEQHDYSVRQMGNQFAQTGRFVGQALPATAAAAAVPEVEAPAALGGVGRLAAPIVTNALRGVAASATNVGANPNVPVGTQLATGALAGVALPPLLGLAGKAGAKIAGIGAATVAPEVRALADTAINKYGIPLRGSQIAGVADPAMAFKDSNLISAPGSGFAANAAAQRTAFTRAVAQTFGADSDKLTPPIMGAARRALGQKFDAFGQAHSIQDVDGLQTRLGQVIADAQQVMPQSEVAPLMRQVENIGDVATADATGNRSIPGDAYLSLTKTGAPLDRSMQSSDSNIRYYAGQIHDALSDAIAQNANPEDVADFANTRLQYKNLMTVKGLAAKAGITGEIPPVQLAGVVNRSFDDRAFSGAGPLGELADIGQAFMKQPPNSGTAQRVAEIAGRNWLPAALGGAAAGEVMTGAGASLLHDPTLAAQLAAGAAITKGASYGVNALSGLRNGALGGRLLVNPPGAVPSALQGIGRGIGAATKSVEVPLSALAGIRAVGGAPVAPVGSYAQ